MPKHATRSTFDHEHWARSSERAWKKTPAPAHAPSRADGLRIELAIQLAHKRVSRQRGEPARQFEHRLERAIDEAMRELGAATLGG